MANSVDPDQIPQNVASDQGLHCLPGPVGPNTYRVIKVYKILSKYPIWLKIYSDFYIFTFFALSEKIGIWQTPWLDLVSVSLCATHYPNYPNALRVMAVFAVTCLMPWSMKSSI